jgi:DNA adenine methylase
MHATPILKWAGGKSQLKSVIEARIPNKFQNKSFNYVEPFIGGGAMFFWLKNNYDIKNAIVNDINPDLINCYQVVQKDVESLIDCLNSFQNKYRALLSDADKKKEFYYSMREAFNSNSGNSIEKAAQLIFLNRTCFNGLYRVNRSGKFNVPIGSYKNPKICDADNLRLAAKAFEDTVITNRDYADALQFANPETLFYLDPPYKPLNATSSFNSYSKGSFDDKEQIRLSEFCHDLTKKKCCWILSNSDVNTEENPDKFFDELYEGFDIRRVKASRLINSISSKRGELNELLISSS